MIWFCLWFIAETILLVPVQNSPTNNTGLLISTYAKVARWGAVNSFLNSSANPNEGRSSGQTLWTHRSDVNVIGGQNLKKKPSVTYLYNVQKPSSKTDQVHQETIPAKGEIQERFNPRPYFEYSPYAKLHKTQVNSQPSVVYATSFTKYPVFNKPSEIADTNSYNSPYSSYNPPDPKPDNSNDNFPPNGNPDDSSPPSGSYLPPPTDSAPPSTSDSYSPQDSSYDSPDSLSIDDNNYQYSQNKPMANDDAKDDFNGPYVYLPPAESPPETDSKPTKTYSPTKIHDADDDNNSGPPITKIVEPPTPPKHSYLEHPPEGWKDDDAKTQSMAEDDLSPPPPNNNANYGKIPDYLDHDPKNHAFDTYNYDHHPVYHEIHPTEQPEDMRVNKGHYSYYYLGRKLWYIPLYFSIYFIIYVTVLILKSIARHKIEFKNKHYHDKHREARKFDINDVHVEVGRAIENTTKKYAFM